MTVRGKGVSLLLMRDLCLALLNVQSQKPLHRWKSSPACLKEQAQRYRALIENANEIIYSHDLEGNYTSINKAGECLTGYSQPEARQLNLDRVIAPEYRETVAQMIQAKLDGEQASFYEIEIITKSGHRLPLEVSTHLILSEGKPVEFKGWPVISRRGDYARRI